MINKIKTETAAKMPVFTKFCTVSRHCQIPYLTGASLLPTEAE